MNPGVFNKYVSLLQLDVSIDDVGGVIEGYSHAAFVWGRKLPKDGREFIAAQTRIGEAAEVFRIYFRSDVSETWRVNLDGVIYEVAAPPVDVDLGTMRRFQDLILTSVPKSEVMNPVSNIWSIPLHTGDVGKTVKFPVPFASIPASLDVQLVTPAGAGSFDLTVSNITATGFDVEFSASVPSEGYSLSVSAFQYATVLLIDLVEGESENDVVFGVAFPRPPRGLKATLLPPDGGYQFTNALVANSLTANGFTLEYGALVPGPGYRAQIKVSL